MGFGKKPVASFVARCAGRTRTRARTRNALRPRGVAPRRSRKQPPIQSQLPDHWQIVRKSIPLTRRNDLWLRFREVIIPVPRRRRDTPGGAIIPSDAETAQPGPEHVLELPGTGSAAGCRKMVQDHPRSHGRGEKARESAGNPGNIGALAVAAAAWQSPISVLEGLALSCERIQGPSRRNRPTTSFCSCIPANFLQSSPKRIRPNPQEKPAIPPLDLHGCAVLRASAGHNHSRLHQQSHDDGTRKHDLPWGNSRSADKWIRHAEKFSFDRDRILAHPHSRR